MHLLRCEQRSVQLSLEWLLKLLQLSFVAGAGKDQTLAVLQKPQKEQDKFNVWACKLTNKTASTM